MAKLALYLKLLVPGSGVNGGRRGSLRFHGFLGLSRILARGILRDQTGQVALRFLAPAEPLEHPGGIEEELVAAAVLGIALFERGEAGERRRGVSFAHVEVPDQELVLGHDVHELGDPRPSLGGVYGVWKLPQEGVVLLDRLAGWSLIPVGLGVLLVVTQRELIARVIAPRRRRVAVEVIAVAEPSLRVAGRRVLPEVGVGHQEKRVASLGIVGIGFEDEVQVFATLVIFFLGDQRLPLIEELLLG